MVLGKVCRYLCKPILGMFYSKNKLGKLEKYSQIDQSTLSLTFLKDNVFPQPVIPTIIMLNGVSILFFYYLEKTRLEFLLGCSSSSSSGIVGKILCLVAYTHYPGLV